MKLQDIRTDYDKFKLDYEDLKKDPISQFETWLNEALSNEPIEPTAFTLATINEEGFPETRILLLKGIENNKLVFFTNYNSDKGEQMKRNPKIAMNFFWPTLQRQVRVTGIVNKISEERSIAYFDSRPVESRIGAIISKQSKILQSRELLEKEYDHFLSSNSEIKKPAHWGGYEVEIVSCEFWQGRPSRLHDRFKYYKLKNQWIIDRLYP